MSCEGKLWRSFMSCVSFMGESAGSFAYRGGESAGSIGVNDLKQSSPISSYSIEVPTKELTRDVVNFRGTEEREKKANSICKTLAGLAVTTGIVIGGLAYAHKAGWITKMGDGKCKDLLTKSAKTCNDWCMQSKESIVKAYNKVKNYFTKKP